MPGRSEKSWLEKKCLGPEKFFQVQAKQSSGLDIPSCQGLKVHFGVVLGSKGGGGKKKLFRSRHFFLNLGPKTLQHRQDKPTQAKGSLWGQMAFSESGWRLAEAVLWPHQGSNLLGARAMLSYIYITYIYICVFILYCLSIINVWSIDAL